MEFLGTDYGGWLLNLDLVPQNSTIISAGIGEDISFDLELIRRKTCQIIGVDPTLKSHKFIESQSDLVNFSLLKKALDKNEDDVVFMYENTNPNYVSESILPTHHSVGKNYYCAETITLPELFKQYENISVVKMDVEGSEYDVLENLAFIPDSVKQMCIEFHHFCTEYDLEDSQKILEHLKNLGFNKVYSNKPNSIEEVTLVRNR